MWKGDQKEEKVDTKEIQGKGSTITYTYRWLHETNKVKNLKYYEMRFLPNIQFSDGRCQFMVVSVDFLAWAFT